MGKFINLLLVTAALVTPIFFNITAANPLSAIPVASIFHPPFPTPCGYDAPDKIKAKHDALIQNKATQFLLGDPISNVEQIISTAPCYGYCQSYKYGTIFYKEGAAEAFEVNGAIAAKYHALNEDRSILHFPTTDETDPRDGTTGRFNEFEGGSIYWKGNIGAHALWGAIHDTWAHQGRESNPRLGYPISDIIEDHGITPFGYWANFENGVLYIAPGGTVQNVVGTDPKQGYMTNSQVEARLLEIISARFDATPWGQLGKVMFVNFLTMQDYSLDGAGLHNRPFVISVHMWFWENSEAEPSAGDIYTDLEFIFEVWLGQGNDLHYIMYSIRQVYGWNPAGVLAGKETFVTETINGILQEQPGQFDGQLNPFVIEVKPMANGDLNVYSRLS